MMKEERIRKLILPTGPILSILLVGLLLLSALMYYRAITIQRFLEPALAMSQPRIKFSSSINNLLLKEFGKEEIKGVKFRTGSILIEQSMLFPDGQNINVAEPVILEKLGNVFLSALSDPDIRDNISLIMVVTRFPLNSGMASNKELRYQMQRRAELIRESLFAIQPPLEEKYGTYFAATAMAVDPTVKDTNWIEFRIISSEMLHIEVLKRLEKYSH